MPESECNLTSNPPTFNNLDCYNKWIAYVGGIEQDRLQKSLGAMTSRFRTSSRILEEKSKIFQVQAQSDIKASQEKLRATLEAIAIQRTGREGAMRGEFRLETTTKTPPRARAVGRKFVPSLQVASLLSKSISENTRDLPYTTDLIRPK
mgnify:CR=1 FL=1